MVDARDMINKARSGAPGGGDGSDNIKKIQAQGIEFFLKYDQQRSIDRFSLEADDSYIYVDYLDGAYRVDRLTALVDLKGADGEWAEFKDPYTSLVLYDMLCCFQDQEGGASLAGDFCPAKSLTSTVMSASLLGGSNKYDVLMGHTDELAAACERLGGTLQPRKARADITYAIPVFKWFNILFQFWDGDEEFAPKVVFLWDKNTLQFMHYETLYYVMSDIMTRLWPGFEEYPERPK